MRKCTSLSAVLKEYSVLLEESLLLLLAADIYLEEDP